MQVFYLILNVVTMMALGNGSSEENGGRERADGDRNGTLRLGGIISLH